MQPLLACLLPSVGASSVVGIFPPRQLNVSILGDQLDRIPTEPLLLGGKDRGAWWVGWTQQWLFRLIRSERVSGLCLASMLFVASFSDELV